ncbi:MAG: DUF4157 domain-containing protein [Candidatus Baltobacteraceae bacterium]
MLSKTSAAKAARGEENAGREFIAQSAGRPLEPAVRTAMNGLLSHDFSRVRVHAESDAGRVAAALDARAFSIDEHVVFGSGEYRPETAEGRYVLAHELRHVAQGPSRLNAGLSARGSASEEDAHAAAAAVDCGAAVPQLPTGTARAGVDRISRGDGDPIHRPVLDEYRYEHNLPFSGKDDVSGEQMGPSDAQIKYGPRQRLDYVFIMGQDRPKTNNPFYTVALRYFRAHVPSAIFVTNLRTLADVVRYVGALQDPAGTIYLVSHANEDGTLSFALNASDTDGRTDANELRAALHPASGGSSLPAVKGKIDAQTTISIKGCNIGQSQEMVELIDEAFGGAGTVVAPKYEQRFAVDPAAGEGERRRIERKIRVTAAHDPQAASTLRAYEGRSIERAATEEGLSGPNIQRPGTRFFTPAEIQTHVNATFNELPAAERADIVVHLARAQRVDAVRPFRERLLLPEDRRAIAAFRAQFQEAGFTPRRLTSHTRSASTPTVHTYTFDNAQGATVDVTVEELDPTAVIDRGKAGSSRPDIFAWTMERSRNGDTVDFTAVGRRVVAELHHRVLTDASGRPYDPSTSDTRFFAHSTFQPPPASPTP